MVIVTACSALIITIT